MIYSKETAEKNRKKGLQIRHQKRKDRQIQVKKLLQKKLKPQQIAEKLNVDRRTIYRDINAIKKES